MPNNDFKHNHYVPEWYQKRFIPDGYSQSQIQYLDLKPPQFRDAKGVLRTHNALRSRPVSKSFAQDDLYTVTFGDTSSRDIERLFFGEIDRNGPAAFNYFADYNHTEINHEAYHSMLLYMSTQKLRTPKGLAWLSQQVNVSNTNELMQAMLDLRNLYGAIWTESVWQIANATNSDTKFIISDHPITVYNRECGPRNKKWCRFPNDPPIHLHGTHTILPLSYDKILILTNKSWARHPYQSAIKPRPNPRYMRNAVFNYTEIQIERDLIETEVRQINFIIKNRAHQYIGAANSEWLFPENYISKSDWNHFGDGHLLMPDPRSVHYGGQIIVGYNNGTSDGFDAYGRKPWEPEYGEDDVPKRGKYDPLERFKSEFARRYGRKRRGRASFVGDLEDEEDSDNYHNSLISPDNPNYRKIR